MANQANPDLLRRIAELEAENTALRERDSAVTPVPPAADQEPGSPRRRRRWPWTLLATVLIVVGAVLAPLALVASWSKVLLTDTDRFVATYAPLAQDEDVQKYVIDETVTVINQQIDIPTLTSDVIDGITDLGTGPRATQALELLKGPAAAGVQSLIERGVTGFVESDAFANVWASALRVSHTQLVSLMENDPDSVVQVGSSGSIGIQLGPIVEAVKKALVDRGIDLANQIPDVDRTIIVAQADALPSVQLFYGFVVAAGAWLPWIAILLLAAGVLVARRRPVALIWAAIALALSMALALAGIVVGNFAIVSALSPDLLPASVTTLLYETVAGDMRNTAVAVLVLAVVVALVGWLAGPFDVPRRMRGLVSEGAGVIRTAAERRGVTTGRVGVWIYTRRALLRAAVAVIASAVVLFVRPVTVSLTLWTLVLAVVALAILELVQRPVVTVPATASEDIATVEVE